MEGIRRGVIQLSTKPVDTNEARPLCVAVNALTRHIGVSALAQGLPGQMTTVQAGGSTATCRKSVPLI
ncbi:hypothetical protein [Sinorhizobium prairiense]|uniref:hypothetical protein n=1 Tax=unclassified Sinorhizobium TaxID=2613772 RepID=UPI0023D87B2A|nr:MULTISPECIES: hypothetical protein [unclassified Sinorhizobium]WEJ08663.1 hypothetical protein N0Q90_00720 [Sinorhizobium sp. M103]WEJ13836.1 hypothetical protein N0Q91_01970 [Sinorhizobium sp. K101]WEJ35433.1 hypothetical protein N0R80_01970 [Sinorhizobium sp. C101]